MGACTYTGVLVCVCVQYGVCGCFGAQGSSIAALKKETLTCELEFNHAGAVKPDVAGKKPELLLNVLRSHTFKKKNYKYYQ